MLSVEQIVSSIGQTSWECLLSVEEYVYSSGHISELNLWLHISHDSNRRKGRAESKI